MLRIVVASQDELMNARLVLLFESHGGVEAAVSASDGLNALDLAWECQPNVVVVGLLDPPLDGWVLLRLIKDVLPGALLVALADPYLDASGVPDAAHAYLRHHHGEALQLVSVADQVTRDFSVVEPHNVHHCVCGECCPQAEQKPGSSLGQL